MTKSQLGSWVWVLIYGGLLAVCVSVFLLRAGAQALGWWMLALGSAAAVSGAALVVVRARMEEPSPAKQKPRP